ncbi:Vacuolar protein sorting protein 36 GLUE domain [Arabidopsis thaliana x Arabidopsis arenosa]|uniref:Vacuolar protein-sorting-associated protein 36 n=1 Tax=Arabidopsis thaliana x Arabidopsis arenosa TaxID=1240361 RepID=A0A8T1YT23_9BRAS|nr:Vacuolar protein sorting protein 36 GLUE domain [Arabidopsis thaliana x Arabidopsis arenosa]
MASGSSSIGIGGLFENAEVTTSGRPVLRRNEVECFLLSSVDIDSEDDPPRFTALRSGNLILTTHRLIWIPSQSNGAVPSSVPLAAVTHIYSHKKSIKSMFHSPRIRFQANPGSIVVTIVFRGKGDFDEFLTKLWECWRGRAWEEEEKSESETSRSGSGTVAQGLYGNDGTVRMVGLAGILRKEQEQWESTDKSLQDAFQDLNALMSKAKEMVSLAEKMRQKLLSAPSSQNGSTDDEEMGSKEEMQQWMLSVGIISPVTKESAGALYHQELSRQLADFVRIPLEQAGGMISLTDMYYHFNRARGTELISPDDLWQACTLWEKFDVPVMLRKFDSGVMVIQNKSHSDEEVMSRIRMLVTKTETLKVGVTASDAALTLKIAPAMAKEHLLTAETKGLLCRDMSPDGLRFYFNLFPEIDPTNIHIVNDFGTYGEWIKATCLMSV